MTLYGALPRIFPAQVLRSSRIACTKAYVSSASTLDVVSLDMHTYWPPPVFEVRSAKEEQSEPDLGHRIAQDKELHDLLRQDVGAS